jgi:hypothetical protein
MAGLIDRRVCAEIDGSFVLFLIGIRLNRLWKPWVYAPVFTAMPRMLVELAKQPELGLLHARTHFGPRNTLLVQYWRSLEQLQAYASAKDKAHLPAWAAFNRAIGTSGDVGIWHETYLVDPGKAESIYVNMPPYGMGKAGRLEDATGPRARAEGRMAAARDGH